MGKMIIVISGPDIATRTRLCNATKANLLRILRESEQVREGEVVVVAHPDRIVNLHRAASEIPG